MKQKNNRVIGVAQVREDGIIFIPEEQREALGIRPGDSVVLKRGTAEEEYWRRRYSVPWPVMRPFVIPVLACLPALAIMIALEQCAIMLRLGELEDGGVLLVLLVVAGWAAIRWWQHRRLPRGRAERWLNAVPSLVLCVPVALLAYKSWGNPAYLGALGEGMPVLGQAFCLLMMAALTLGPISYFVEWAVRFAGTRKGRGKVVA